MRRRVVRLVGAGLMVAGAAVIGLAPSAQAATLGDTGWWSRTKQGPLEATPNPPNVPEGGLYVAGAPDEATAIAALRFTLDDGERDPVLTLDVSDPTSPPEGEEPAPPVAPPAEAPVPAPSGGDVPEETKPVILACQSGSKWKAVDGGAWKAKPKVACGAGKVTGHMSPDGKTWEWDLSSLQIKTTLDVVLVPGKVNDVGSTFQIAFEKPEASSLQTTPGMAPTPIVPAGDFSPVPEASSGGAAVDDTSSSAGGFEAAGEDPGTSFDAGDDTSDSGPSLSEDEQGLEQDAPLAENAQAPQQPVSSTTRNTRAIGIGVLVVGAALALFANQQPVPALRKLGPFGTAGGATPQPGQVPAQPQAVAGEPLKGGLGRFARSRSGPAPRL